MAPAQGSPWNPWLCPAPGKPLQECGVVVSTTGRGETSSASPSPPHPHCPRRERTMPVPSSGGCPSAQGAPPPSVRPSLGLSPRSHWVTLGGWPRRCSWPSSPGQRLLTRARMRVNIGLYFLLKAPGRATGLLDSGAAQSGLLSRRSWSAAGHSPSGPWWSAAR